MSPSADDLVAEARRRIQRIRPEDLDSVASSGGLVVDIRPNAQRLLEGELPGALVIERNVLEWRLDPNGAHRLPAVTGFDQQVVVVCSEGYASSLAAASLADLGFRHAGDLAGGYCNWSAWAQSLPSKVRSRPSEDRTSGAAHP
ncbi:MAG: rhodanese-like domain-containing protein [Acidimicrobiales bacterium]|jgi:rhodanese-related sulfurtransferase